MFPGFVLSVFSALCLKSLENRLNMMTVIEELTTVILKTHIWGDINLKTMITIVDTKSVLMTGSY